MAIKINGILPKSLAASKGIAAGDILVSINGNEIRDFLDLEFYAADFSFILELIRASGEKQKISITRDNNRPLGLEPEPYTVRSCENACVFCFIDQMPPRLRSSLYDKDDDFLYSFVFGNYITLTNLSEADYQRICSQRISPLYISLHTTDNALRQKMMRSANAVDVRLALTRLSEAGISFHLQIVCVPGYNDGAALEATLNDLLGSNWNCLSIGIVPVGLTKYRSGLCELKCFSPSGAAELLELVLRVREKYSSKIVYPADEFYVLAGREIPSEDFYQDYPQLENGIGMLRLSKQTFKQKKRALLKELRKKPNNYLMISSLAAQGLIFEIINELNQRLENQCIRMQTIRNDFFGPQISVCGLITFSDLKEQLQPRPGEIIILPSSIFNSNGETLDGADRLAVKQNWENPILLIDQFFEDWDYL